MRRMGTEGDAQVRAYIMAVLAQFGVDCVEEQPYEVTYQQVDRSRLEVEGAVVACYFMRGAALTGEAGVTGVLLYVGEAIDPTMDYAGKIVVFDIRGQAVPGAAAPHLADFIYDPHRTLAQGRFGGKAGAIPANFPVSYYMAADQGAIGMIGILKDYETGSNKFYSDPSAMVQRRIPALFVGKYDGAALIDQIRAADQPLQATMVLNGELKSSQSANIVATLNGQKADTILLNTHHDAGWSGAVQDASGVAALLGLVKYFSRIPANFRQKRLLFVFDGSHYNWNCPMGANLFADANPDVMKSVVLAMSVEHIAKKFTAQKGGYVDTAEIEPRLLFTPPNKLLFELTKRAIVESNLHDVIIPKNGAITMFGETQAYFLNGIPCFSYIAGPEYLFLADDTIDKIADEQFEPVIKTFITIIDGVMYWPASWIERIDRF